MPKSKKFEGIHHIYDPIFRVNYYYVEAKDAAHLKEKVKAWIDLDIECLPRTEGCFRPFSGVGGEDGIIWAKGNRSDILAHECFHAMVWLFDRKGISIDRDNDEMGGYYMQFLMKGISNKVKVKP